MTEFTYWRNIGDERRNALRRRWRRSETTPESYYEDKFNSDCRAAKEASLRYHAIQEEYDNNASSIKQRIGALNQNNAQQKKDSPRGWEERARQRKRESQQMADVCDRYDTLHEDLSPPWCANVAYRVARKRQECLDRYGHCLDSSNQSKHQTRIRHFREAAATWNSRVQQLEYQIDKFKRTGK
jgi:hypothetical protein